MYIGFRWNISILPPPIVDWSPKLTSGSRSRSNLKSPWDGEINTRPHGAHANDCQSLCSLPDTQQKTARANPRHEWDSTLLKSWIYSRDARHSRVWWVVALGHRWKQVLRFLFHIASLWIQWKQNETNTFYDICIKSVYDIYIYLSYVKYVWSPRRVSSIGTKGAKKVRDLAWAPCSQPMNLWISPTSPHNFAQFYLQPRHLGLRDIPSWKAKGVLMFLKGFLVKTMCRWDGASSLLFDRWWSVV